jgi:sugar O-acyltransferase (sialic acid O-acetyltransferase NeuD family)
VKLLVIGAGGHAKVVVDAALQTDIDVVAVVGGASDPKAVLGIGVVDAYDAPPCDAFIVAIGDNAARARLFAEYCARGLTPASVVHPAATISPSAEIARGTFVAAGVIVNPETHIGENCILNTGCTIDHDCDLGPHVHVGPGVNLCGAVSIDEGALIGVGACAAPGTSVGAWSVVGAGAAVVGSLPGRSVCTGVPARVVRSTGEPA